MPAGDVNIIIAFADYFSASHETNLYIHKKKIAHILLFVLTQQWVVCAYAVRLNCATTPQNMA